MAQWQLQEAKQQFSRLVDLARSDGPQVVTRNGREVAVVLAVEDYRRLSDDGGAFKDFLIGAPSLDALEIDRPQARARVIDL